MARPLPRIHLAKRAGKPVSFGVDDRARIEKAFGHKLSTEQWEQIAEKTSMLSSVLTRIRSAAEVTPVLKKVGKLTAAAISLRQELTEKPLPNYESSTLQEIYAEFFSYPKERMPLPYQLSLTLFLLDVVNATIASCQLVQKHGEDRNRRKMITFSEGEIWDVWINTLTTIMKDNGLPYEVRKDVDKRKGDSPSPFVALIRELQKSLPKELRKSMTSDDALAQRISRARGGAGR
jgi:hypothetical protein